MAKIAKGYEGGLEALTVYTTVQQQLLLTLLLLILL